MQGFVNILKPAGLTSSDVVVRVRGILRRLTGDKHKIGHLGTLDPGACGVLPIAVGKATKLFDLLAVKNKYYRARIVFGTTTDTLDSYGIITDKNVIMPSKEQILEVLPKFIGQINQTPPKYSALSINGSKAYDLARQGVEFELNSRVVTINDIILIDYDNNSCIIDIDCMGGTYIRSLVRDIALRLNTVAYMSYLIRLRSGNFLVNDSITLEEFEAMPYVQSLDLLLTDYERYDIDMLYKQHIINGIPIYPVNMPDGIFAVYLENSLFGMAHANGNRLIIDVRLV